MFLYSNCKISQNQQCSFRFFIYYVLPWVMSFEAWKCRLLYDIRLLFEKWPKSCQKVTDQRCPKLFYCILGPTWMVWRHCNHHNTRICGVLETKVYKMRHKNICNYNCLQRYLHHTIIRGLEYKRPASTDKPQKCCIEFSVFLTIAQEFFEWWYALTNPLIFYQSILGLLYTI